MHDGMLAEAGLKIVVLVGFRNSSLASSDDPLRALLPASNNYKT